jgi:hypothetical protein
MLVLVMAVMKTLMMTIMMTMMTMMAMMTIIFPYKKDIDDSQAKEAQPTGRHPNRIQCMSLFLLTFALAVAAQR